MADWEDKRLEAGISAAGSPVVVLPFTPSLFDPMFTVLRCLQFFLFISFFSLSLCPHVYRSPSLSPSDSLGPDVHICPDVCSSHSSSLSFCVCPYVYSSVFIYFRLSLLVPMSTVCSVFLSLYLSKSPHISSMPQLFTCAQPQLSSSKRRVSLSSAREGAFVAPLCGDSAPGALAWPLQHRARTSRALTGWVHNTNMMQLAAPWNVLPIPCRVTRTGFWRAGEPTSMRMKRTVLQIRRKMKMRGMRVSLRSAIDVSELNVGLVDKMGRYSDRAA